MISLLTQGPQIEPVTVAQLRDHLRLDSSEDNLLASLISSARMVVEAQSGVHLINQKWNFILDEWPQNHVALSQWPVISVDKINVIGTEVELVSPETYRLETYARPATIWLNEGQIWPQIKRDKMGIVIEASIGYGARADDVPEPLRHVIMLLAAHWFESNEWNGQIPSSLIPASITGMLQNYRQMRI